MDQDLISKKELLELTGISYGTLYRWKRKNLIPDEWFIKKSVSTGQETFFPRQKILSRIEKIQSLKDGMSLGRLVDVLSPNLMKTALYKSEVIERNIVTVTTMKFFLEQAGDTEVFSFDKVLYLLILEKMLKGGQINKDEGKLLMKVLSEQYHKFSGKNCELLFIRKMGIPIFIIVSSPVEIYFDDEAKLIARLNISSYIEELNLKLS